LFAVVKEALAPVQVFRSFYLSKLIFSPVAWNEEQFTWHIGPAPLHTAIQNIVLLAVVSWPWGLGFVCWSNINLLDSGVRERLPCSSCHRAFCLTRFSACSPTV